MATTKLNRRQFMQVLAAGMAVASMPAAMPLAERVEAATKEFKVPGWNFILRGGSGPVGDSLIMLPPGVWFDPNYDGRRFVWPERLPVSLLSDDFNTPITLTPWQNYRESMGEWMDKKLSDKSKRVMKLGRKHA